MSKNEITMRPTNARVVVELTVAVEVAGYGPAASIAESIEDACREAQSRVRFALGEKSGVTVLSAKSARVVCDAEAIR